MYRLTRYDTRGDAASVLTYNDDDFNKANEEFHKAVKANRTANSNDENFMFGDVELVKVVASYDLDNDEVEVTLEDGVVRDDTFFTDLEAIVETLKDGNPKRSLALLRDAIEQVEAQGE